MRQGHCVQYWQRMAYTDPLVVGWRSLPLEALEGRILLIRRVAAQKHLDLYYWKILDRMRARAKNLRGQLAVAP